MNEVILRIEGSQTNQEIKIIPLDSNIPLATYYSKEEGISVFDKFIQARRNIYKLEHAKELLTPEEIERIIKNDYLFQFPEEKTLPRSIGGS